MADSQVRLEVVGLSKGFAPPQEGAERVWALRDVSLSAKSGEFICLIGPSGCGKTTLIRAVCRLHEGDAGEILVDGRSDYRPGRDVCMVFQNHGLFPWRTALENIEYGLKMQGMAADQRRPIAAQYLEMVGLKQFGNHYPHQMSGGMQQRIGLARAMACEPRVLLMDEPFAAVDAQTRERLQGELMSLWQRTAMTVLFVTHSIDEAVFLADRVIVMGRNPGHIAADLPIRLPRPRDRESMAYVERARMVREALRQASHEGAEREDVNAGD
jgi:NitT/TauT family transport system ATP-binding protein